MGSLALGLFAALGAASSEGAARLLIGGGSLAAPALFTLPAALLGAPLGLWTRRRLLAGRSTRLAAPLTALLFMAAGLASGLFTQSPAAVALRASLWGLAVLLGGVWSARAILRIAMTC